MTDTVTTLDAWCALPWVEHDAVWERLFRDFAFQPTGALRWPNLREPQPFITFAAPEACTDEDIDDLHRRVLRAFRACTEPEEVLYALDFNHMCYWLAPHGNFRRCASGEDAWFISLYLEWDYIFFLAEDFRFGIYGNWSERSWCVFGSELVGALEGDRPRLFSSILRRSSGSGDHLVPRSEA